MKNKRKEEEKRRKKRKTNFVKRISQRLKSSRITLRYYYLCKICSIRIHISNRVTYFLSFFNFIFIPTPILWLVILYTYVLYLRFFAWNVKRKSWKRSVWLCCICITKMQFTISNFPFRFMVYSIAIRSKSA